MQIEVDHQKKNSDIKLIENKKCEYMRVDECR